MGEKLGQKAAFPFEQIHQRMGGIPSSWTNHDGLIKREYAAIKLRVPDSGEKWLDEMIKKANRRDTACAAMHSIISDSEHRKHLLMDSMSRHFNPEELSIEGFLVKKAYKYADELLKQENQTEQ